MRPLHILASIGAAVALAAAVIAQAPGPRSSAFARATADKPSGDWPSYGGTNWSQKYSALDQIGRSNFNALKVAWTWSSPDHELIRKIPDNVEEPYSANGMKATPLVVKGVMYVSTGLGQIAAIEPATGTTAKTTSASSWGRWTGTCWRSTPGPAGRSRPSATAARPT